MSQMNWGFFPQQQPPTTATPKVGWLPNQQSHQPAPYDPRADIGANPAANLPDRFVWQNTQMPFRWGGNNLQFIKTSALPKGSTFDNPTSRFPTIPGYTLEDSKAILAPTYVKNPAPWQVAPNQPINGLPSVASLPGYDASRFAPNFNLASLAAPTSTAQVKTS